MDKPTDAYILARVSTKEQENDAQLNPLRDYCQKKGFTVLREVPIEESAFKRTRKKFHELVSELKRVTRGKCVALCADKIDRLGRGFNEDVLDIVYMVKAGKLELHFLSDWLIVSKDSPAAIERQLLSGLSDGYYYSAASRDNQKRYQNLMREQGRYWSKAGVGYMHITIGGKKDILKDPVRGPQMLEAFKLRATGQYTLRECARIMRDRGLTTNSKLARPITQSVLDHAFRNPFYMGYFTMPDGTLKRHNYEPIVDEETWYKCQNVNKRKSRLEKKVFGLTGVIRCAYCDCSISPSWVRKREELYGVYLRCTKGKGPETCPGNSISQTLVFKQFKKGFTKFRVYKWEIAKSLEQMNANRSNNLRTAARDREEMEKAVENLQIEIKDTVQMRRRGEISEEVMKLVLTDAENKLTLKKSQLEKLAVESTELLPNLTTDHLYRLLSEAGELLSELSSIPALQREFLTNVVSNCSLAGKKVEFSLTEPFRRLDGDLKVRNGGP